MQEKSLPVQRRLSCGKVFQPICDRMSVRNCSNGICRTALGLRVSPYMLDVLLVYSYDKNTSYGL